MYVDVSSLCGKSLKSFNAGLFRYSEKHLASDNFWVDLSASPALSLMPIWAVLDPQIITFLTNVKQLMKFRLEPGISS